MVSTTKRNQCITLGSPILRHSLSNPAPLEIRTNVSVSMHVSMHASMHGCMYGCMHASMHLCVHLCIHTCWMHPCMHASMQPCVHPCMHGHYFKVQNRGLTESEGSVWAPKQGLEGLLALKADLRCESSVPATHFWIILEAPRRPKSINNRVKMMLRMRKVKMLIFDTPPLQNQYFWGPMEAKMDVK